MTCLHTCSSNCRREGCNCECGEFHNATDLEQQIRAIAEFHHSAQKNFLDSVRRSRAMGLISKNKFV